jgi:hypothetical protein
MRTRHALATAAIVAMQADVHALTTPSASDGPVRLISCTVMSNGILEARVDNTGDEAMFCNVRCSYELSGRMFSHSFSATIPKHFQGSIGKFDTNNARPGNYPGEVGSCKKVSADER